MTVEPTGAIRKGPYRSIHPFRYIDRDIFFGRELLIQELYAKILLYRLTVVFGESGAGKSSLLSAGLIPTLLNEGFSAERIRVRPIPDQPLSVERIQATETTEHESFLPSIFADGTTFDSVNERSILCSLKDFFKTVKDKAVSRRPLLIFDQFEELFTLFGLRHEKGGGAEEVQYGVLKVIYEIAKDESLNAKIVVVIREDFLGKLQILAKDYPRVLDYRVRVPFLSKNEAILAILGPFLSREPTNLHTGELGPLKFAKNIFPSRLSEFLANRISTDLSANEPTGQIWPTQLQIVCSRLWDTYASKKAVIEESDYELLDGVAGIVEGFLQSELSQIGESQTLAVRILAHLITQSNTRDVVSAEKITGLIPDHHSTVDVEDVLDVLEERRLVSKTSQRGTYFYELASEYLIPPIIKERMRLSAKERDEETSSRVRRVVWIAALVLILAALAMYSYFHYESEKASIAAQHLKDEKNIEAAQDTIRARAAAYRATYDAFLTPRQRILLALQSVSITEITESTAALDSALQSTRPNVPDIGVAAPVPNVLIAEFDRDAHKLATLAQDGEVSVWKRKPKVEPTKQRVSPDLVSTFKYDDGANARLSSAVQEIPVVSPEDPCKSSKSLTTNDTAEPLLWDALEFEKFISLKPGSDPSAKFAGIAFSPTGRYVLTIEPTGTLRVWDVVSECQIHTVPRSQAPVAAAFSPNEHFVATSSAAKATIWSFHNGSLRLSHDLMCPPSEGSSSGKGCSTSGITSIAFGPDSIVATSSQNGVIAMWDVETGKWITSLSPTGAVPISLAFDKDGKKLALTSSKGPQLLDATSGMNSNIWWSDQSRIVGVNFSADGKYLAAARNDGTVSLHILDKQVSINLLRIALGDDPKTVQFPITSDTCISLLTREDLAKDLKQGVHVDDAERRAIQETAAKECTVIQ